MLRVGIRVNPTSSGGGRAFVELLYQALEAHASCDEVTLFAMGADCYGLASTVTVDVASGPLRRRVGGRRALAKALEGHEIDVLVCPGTEVTAAPGVPTIMWPLTVAPFEEAARQRLGASRRERMRWELLRVATSTACRSADAFVFSSHYARGLYSDHVPAVRSSPTTVIRPAATLDGVTRGNAREVGSDYVLFVSHLYPYKMVVEMLRGYALARSGGFRHELVVAGAPVHPGYARQIDDEIRRSRIGDSVRLLGAVDGDRLRGLYEHASAFVFPSISENAGSYALIDAFRAGVPVLASSASSVPEACQDGARYFDPRDPSALAEGLLRLDQVPGALDRLRERSAQRGSEYGTWADIADELLTFCRGVVVRSTNPEQAERLSGNTYGATMTQPDRD